MSINRRRWALSIVCVMLVAVVATPAIASGEPPQAHDDSLTAIQGESATLNVLENDTDPENDHLTVTDNTGSSQGGQVTCDAEGECTYTDPGGPCPFSDSFEYTVSDGTSTDTAVVQVEVQCGGGNGGGGGGGGGRSFAKTISFQLKGSLKAVGKVTSKDARCVAAEPVFVQVKKHGQYEQTKKTTTKANGSYSVALPNLFGTYRVITPQSSAGRDGCKAANSKPRSYLSFDPQKVTDGDDVSGPLDVKLATIDRDAKNYYMTIATHGKWTKEDINSSSKRFEAYFQLGGGDRYWIVVSWGEDIPIVSVTYCEAQCDNDNVKFGEGEKAGPKTMRFWAKKSHFDKLGKTIHWQAGSAYGDSTFDLAPNQGSKTYKL